MESKKKQRTRAKAAEIESDYMIPPPLCTSPDYCPLAVYQRGGRGRICPRRDPHNKLFKTLALGCPFRKKNNNRK